MEKPEHHELSGAGLSQSSRYDICPRAMTILEALAILEAAVLECKKREINTPEVTGALNLLELYIRPTWLIPQFRRNALDGFGHNDVDREGQQQVLRTTFPGIRDCVRVLLEVRMGRLAPRNKGFEDKG
jgi:hypothetical protein